MATYKVIKEVGTGAGYLYYSVGQMVPMQSLAPNVGDIVNGVIEDHTIGNITQRGISVEISTGPDTGQNSLVFIPESSLELTNGATPPAASAKSPFAAGNLALLALIIIAAVLIFKKS